MPRLCTICGKGKSVGNYRKLLRGHENPTGRRTFAPNLQKFRYAGRRGLACAKCIRTQSRLTSATVPTK